MAQRGVQDLVGVRPVENSNTTSQADSTVIENAIVVNAD